MIRPNMIRISISRFFGRWPWHFLALEALVFTLLWLDIFCLPYSPISPESDVSWSAALVHFTAEGLQFGKEVIFTYGPLSHFVTFIYTGELFASRVIWELVSTTFFAAVLCAATFRLPQSCRRVRRQACCVLCPPRPRAFRASPTLWHVPCCALRRVPSHTQRPRCRYPS